MARRTDEEKRALMDEYYGLPIGEKAEFRKKHGFGVSGVSEWKKTLGWQKSTRRRASNGHAPASGKASASVQALQLENTVLRAFAKWAIQKGVLD